MKKCRTLSKETLLSEYERLFRSTREYNHELIFEDNNQLLYFSPLSYEELSKEYLNDIYSGKLNILGSYLRKTSHPKHNDKKKKSTSLERSGSQNKSRKDFSGNKATSNTTADIADDYEMMKEKYRKWKKKMDLES